MCVYIYVYIYIYIYIHTYSHTHTHTNMQGPNLCLLHWQVGSLPLSYQGSTNVIGGLHISLLTSASILSR